MPRYLATLVLFAVATLPATPLWAADGVSAQLSVDRTEVAVGDDVRYTIEASVQSADPIELVRSPSFGSALRVVGRRRSPRLVIRNGRPQRSKTITYRLRATAAGEHTIEPPVLRVGSKRIELEARTITVTKGASGRQNRGSRGSSGRRGGGGGSSRARKRNDLFLSADLRPTKTPYVGQQLILSYYLYKTPHKFDLEPRPPEEPSLDTFWIEGLSEEFAGQTRMVDTRGRLMERTTMRKYAIFPLETGTTTIDSMQVDVVSGGFFSQKKSVTIESPPIEVDVQPLPNGAPDSFEEGNIGSWHFSADLDRSASAVGEAVTLTLEASGYGNLRSLTLPDVSGVDGLEVTSRQEETRKEIRQGKLWGEKRVEYTLVPTREGRIEIPELAFSYFDPSDETYETQRSEAFELSIEGGKLSDLQKKQFQGDDPDASEDSTGDEEAESATDRLLGRLHGPLEDVSLSPPEPLPFAPTVYWLLVGGGGLGVVFLLVGPGLWRRLRRSDSTRGRTDAREEAEAELKRAGDADPEEAPVLVLRALKTYLTAAIGCPGGEWTGPELEEWLRDADVPEATVETCVELLNWCQDARFAPAATLDRDELERAIATCEEVIETIDGQLDGRDAPPSSAALVAGVAAGLCLLSAPAPTSAASPDGQNDRLQQAVEAQKSGNWTRAVELWGTLADAHPASADVRYHYGTALLHRGDLARGRLALERAVLSDPGLEPARANLEIARRLVRRERIERARGRASIPAPPSSLQRWDRRTRIPTQLLAIGLLLGLWGLFGALLLRRLSESRRVRMAALVVGAVAVLTTLGTATAWWARHATIVDTHPAVVTAEEVELHEAPSPHASIRRAELPIVPGVRAAILEERDDWTKVALSEETTGWMPTASLTSLKPR